MRLIVNGIIHVLIPVWGYLWHSGTECLDMICRFHKMRSVQVQLVPLNISSLLSIYTHIVVYYSAVRQPLYVYSSSSAKTY